MASNLKECDICLEEFRKPDKPPKKLPCDHTVCGGCVTGIVKGRHITCPTCRKDCEISDVKHDFQRENFIEVLDSALAEQARTLTKSTLQSDKSAIKTSTKLEGDVCELCESRAVTYWCQECEQWTCRECKNSHLKAKSSRDHTMKNAIGVKQEQMTHVSMHIKQTIQTYTKSLTTCQEAKADENKRQEKLLASLRRHEDEFKEKLTLYFTALREKIRAEFTQSTAQNDSKIARIQKSLSAMQKLHGYVNDMQTDIQGLSKKRIALFQSCTNTVARPEVASRANKVTLEVDKNWQPHGLARVTTHPPGGAHATTQSTGLLPGRTPAMGHSSIPTTLSRRLFSGRSTRPLPEKRSHTNAFTVPGSVKNEPQLTSAKNRRITNST